MTDLDIVGCICSRAPSGGLGDRGPEVLVLVSSKGDNVRPIGSYVASSLLLRDWPSI